MSASETGSAKTTPARRLLKWGGAVVLVVALVGGTAAAWAHSQFGDPGKMATHMEHRLKSTLEDVGASAAQQEQVAQIFKVAAEDLRAIKDQYPSGGHKELHQILTGPSIDRNRLEILRSEHLRFADEASRRLTLALADAAEVLTPEQRAAVTEKMAKKSRHWHGDAE
jgi:Spy/CpxP family protein refolding chaperone